MNFDGRVTITDVWLWVKWLYFYPGDWLLSTVMFTSFGDFFELSADNFGGGWSFLISLVCWGIVCMVAAAMEQGGR
jgi:hypothetical protein